MVSAPVNGKEPEFGVLESLMGLQNGLKNKMTWWPETESNRRHEDFQSSALPTELSGPNGLLLNSEKRFESSVPCIFFKKIESVQQFV